MSVPIVVLSLELGKSVWRHVHAAKVLVMHNILEGASDNRLCAADGPMIVGTSGSDQIFGPAYVGGKATELRPCSGTVEPA